MKKANIIMITNNTDYHVVLWPNKKEFSDFAIFVGSHSYKIVDYTTLNFTVDLDRAHFKFEKDKKKIKVDDIENYGIQLEYMLR